MIPKRIGYSTVCSPSSLVLVAVQECGGRAAVVPRHQPLVPTADTLTSRAVAQVSSLTSPLSRSKMGPFVRSFLRVIVRSAS